MTETQEIIRLARTDLKGKRTLKEGIKEIKGIGDTMGVAMARAIPVDEGKKLGDLDDEELEEIEKVMENPGDYGLPAYIFNRRRDIETGENLHLTTADIEMKEKFDIRREKKIDSYRGIRHRQGLPVRGQKTKSSFRTGRKVGVSRERIKEEQAEREEEEGEE